MDNRPRLEEASVERVRESLIAISDCDPEKLNPFIEPDTGDSQDKAQAPVAKIRSTVDEVRSKLISIASDPSQDPTPAKSNGYL